jgi:hypothetical protein
MGMSNSDMQGFLFFLFLLLLLGLIPAFIARRRGRSFSYSISFLAVFKEQKQTAMQFLQGIYPSRRRRLSALS